MKIELNKLTQMEQEFVTVALKNFNDLMFTDDIDDKYNSTLTIPKQSLSGVISSLVKKGIIEHDFSHNDTSFLFTSQEDDVWNRPELV